MAFCDDQFSVTVLLGRMAVASAVMAGFGAPHAVTLAVPDIEPPEPLQVSVYPEEPVTLTFADPEVGCDPDQPPEAAQEVALVELHVSVTAPPICTALADALIDTLGGGPGVPPPPPPQA